jgi:hypothetical protein
MKRLYVIPATLGIFAFAAAAQDEPAVVLEKRMAELKQMTAQVRVVGLQGGIMGKTVKGAPYSAVEVNESTQMLADGTRIHNESQTQVFRDSEGRMRRETPNEITIWDPVANTSYLLNPKTQTARKMPMGTFFFKSDRAGNGEVSTVLMRSGAGEGTHVAYAASEAKLKAEIEAGMKAGGTGPGNVGFATGPNVEIMQRKMTRREKLKEEPLGKQTIEGVSSEGTRTVSTIEAGAIGNDRPIQNVSERWFSPELQTVMLTRSTDPRMGEEVFKLINVSRAEPAAYLFQVPAGYQIVEAK